MLALAAVGALLAALPAMRNRARPVTLLRVRLAAASPVRTILQLRSGLSQISRVISILSALASVTVVGSGTVTISGAPVTCGVVSTPLARTLKRVKSSGESSHNPTKMLFTVAPPTGVRVITGRNMSSCTLSLGAPMSSQRDISRFSASGMPETWARCSPTLGQISGNSALGFLASTTTPLPAGGRPVSGSRPSKRSPYKAHTNMLERALLTETQRDGVQQA